MTENARKELHEKYDGDDNVLSGTDASHFPDEEKRILKKIDCVILPMVWFIGSTNVFLADILTVLDVLGFLPAMYAPCVTSWANFNTFATDLDKQSLSYAAVFGLIEDLDLQGSQYSWCTSTFYFGVSSLVPKVFVF